MPTSAISLRPFAPSGRFKPARGPKLAAGDLVTWTNANTGQEWTELEVVRVLDRQGVVTLRGCFGRVNPKTDRFVIDEETVRVDQVRLDRAAAERVA